MTKLISVHPFKVDISPSLHAQIALSFLFQQAQSRLLKSFRRRQTEQTDGKSGLCLSISHRIHVNFAFLGSSTGGQCCNCPSVQQRHTGSNFNHYFCDAEN